MFQTLQGNSDLNNPRQLTKEAAKELTLVEKRLQDAYVDHTEPKLDCIFIFLPSTHSLTWLIIQREESILEWIFLAHKVKH